MIVGILIALLVTVIVYAFARFITARTGFPAEFVWVVWIIAAVVIVLVWWNRVLEPLIGPLP